MRAQTLLALAAALLLLSTGASADSWAYTYGGLVDPTWSGWSQNGGAEQPVWNVDTGDGNKALVITHDAVARPENQPYYQITPTSGHVALIWQIRFRIEGGAAFNGNDCYYWRLRYNDGRSRMWHYTDADPVNPSDDFMDPDMFNNGVETPPLAPFDNDWHTYTIVMVGAGLGAANEGSIHYWDGVQVGTREAGLASPSFDQIIGIVRKPPAEFGTCSLWVDYVTWGFDDTADEFGNYGWDINDLPELNPDFVPEPASLAVIGVGLLGIAGGLRRRLR